MSSYAGVTYFQKWSGFLAHPVYSRQIYSQSVELGHIEALELVAKGLAVAISNCEYSTLQCFKKGSTKTYSGNSVKS